MAHYEDLNTTKIALVGFISTVFVFALILLLMVLFHREMAAENQLKVVDQPAAEFDSLTADQRGKLASYRWIDPEKKIVQIPVKQAMDMVVEELQKSPAGEVSKEPERQQDPAEKTPKDKPLSERAHADKTTTESPSPVVPPVNAPPVKEDDHGF